MFYIYFYTECIALLVSIFQYKKLKNSNYKYFLPFLALIVIYEYGNIWDWFYIDHSNLYITNLSEISVFLFFSIFLRSLIRNEIYKKIIRGLIIFSVICAAINMAFIQGFWKLDTITILLQFAIIIVIVCLYFFELMNKIESEVSIINIPGFWLNTGLLFFCLAQFLFFSVFAFLAYNQNHNYFLLAVTVSNIANVILYSCISVCLLCFNRMKK
jgi:hypothetical protein